MIRLNFGLIEVFSKGLNWIALPLLAYVTTLELYGKISSYYALVMILSIFYTFGQNRNILQSKINELEENTALSVYIGLFLLIISFFVVAFFLEDNNFYLCAILAFLLSVYNNYSLKIRSENKTHNFMFFKSYYGFRLILLLLFLWFYPSFDTFFLVDVTLLTIFLISQFRLIKPKSSLNQLYTKTKNSLMMMFFSFSIIFIMGFDKIYLSSHVEYGEIGRYNLAFVFATGVTFMASYFAISYERDIYTSNDLVLAQSKTNDFIKKTVYCSVILFPLILSIYWLYSIFVGTEPKIKIFSLIYTSQIIYFFCLGRSFLLTYMGEYKKIAIMALMAIIVNISLNIILVGDYSVTGSALSNLFSFMIMACCFFVWSKDR